jgi:signal transduction histidine kinase
VRFELENFKDDGRPEPFITDDQRLKQIMINLLRNSVKFTMAGVIRLSAEVILDGAMCQVCQVARHKKLRLVFYDTGMGIKE